MVPCVEGEAAVESRESRESRDLWLCCSSHLVAGCSPPANDLLSWHKEDLTRAGRADTAPDGGRSGRPRAVLFHNKLRCHSFIM